MTRHYACNGLAGCVEQRRCHETGTLVGVYRNDQAGLDDSDGLWPWSVVCEAHGTVNATATLAGARYHATNPTGWCEQCRAEHGG